MSAKVYLATQNQRQKQKVFYSYSPTKITAEAVSIIIFNASTEL